MPKNDLFFRKPVMNAAGMLGFALDPRVSLPGLLAGGWADFGAFVTNPLSMRPRRPAAQPVLLEYPGGMLLHTGLPNPGLTAVVRKYGRRWASSPLPVIPHLMVDQPEETGRMVRSLEGMENIAGVELGFAPLMADEIILMAVEYSRGELPLIVNLPLDRVLSLGARTIQRGAAAISFTPPRGSLPNPQGEPGETIRGRLYGPGLYPMALDVLHSAAQLGLPVIGGLGVGTVEQVECMLQAGALAVQIDTALWL
jgi:dihydroorotate dehydrogenase (NAD+) catalytic subunit